MDLNYGTFGLNENYDMSLDSGGNLIIAYNIDAIVQNVTSAIRLWFGEYDFNTQLGVNYYNYFGNLVPVMTVKIKRDITNAILGVQGVSKVNSLTYSYDSASGALSGIANISVNLTPTITTTTIVQF